MQRPPRTVREAISQATIRLGGRGSETPRLDAELLLGHVLGVERTALAAHPEAPLGRGQVEAFEAFVARRENGEPVAYIRGLKEFYGAALAVDRRVLIPRPETETLVELALQHISTALTSAPRPTDALPYLVWDVGTGSGAIAVAIGRELRRRSYGEAVHFHVSDISADAMAVATINVVSHGLADVITFAEGDLCDALPSPRPVDLLLANLPYIPSTVVPGLPIAASYEPVIALDGGVDGLALVRRLLPQLPLAVAHSGTAMLEIGSGQEDALLALAARVLPLWEGRALADLSGRPRVVVLERRDA